MPTVQTLVGIAHYCADYHQGFNSRLYRLGCRVQFYLADKYNIRAPLDWPLTGTVKRTYSALEKKGY